VLKPACFPWVVTPVVVVNHPVERHTTIVVSQPVMMRVIRVIRVIRVARPDAAAVS